MSNTIEWTESESKSDNGFHFISRTKNIDAGSQGPNQVREIANIPIQYKVCNSNEILS